MNTFKRKSLFAAIFAVVLSCLTVFAAPSAIAAPTPVVAEGYGQVEHLDAGVTREFSFATKSGCSSFKYAGDQTSPAANVVLEYGAASPVSGPAGAVRQITLMSTGAQVGKLTASADTVVKVFYYDRSPTVVKAYERGTRKVISETRTCPAGAK